MGSIWPKEEIFVWRRDPAGQLQGCQDRLHLLLGCLQLQPYWKHTEERVTLVVDPGPASFTSNHQCWIQGDERLQAADECPGWNRADRLQPSTWKLDQVDQPTSFSEQNQTREVCSSISKRIL